MTSQRRERKPCRLSVGFLAILGAAGVVLMVAAALRSHAAEPVALNRYTGLAIDGFDPVAYFTDGRARPGRPDLELRSGGARAGALPTKAIWRHSPPIPRSMPRDLAVTTRSRLVSLDTSQKIRPGIHLGCGSHFPAPKSSL